MAEKKQDTEQIIDLSDDDLEATLRLLSDEEHLGKTERSALRVLLFFIVAITTLVFACPAGLLIVWFDRALGIGLLIASAAAFVVMMALAATKRNPFKSLTVVRQSVEDSQVGQAIAARVKPSQASAVSILLGCGGGLVMLLFFPVVAWFFYDLVTTSTVNLLSLILIAALVVVVYSLVYYQMRRDFLHYSRVSRLRGLLESQAQGAEKKAISSEQVSFLRQVETKQMVREARQVEPEVRMQDAESYPIIIDVKAREYLECVPLEQSLALRRIIDSLQFDPRPSNAKSVVTEDTEMLVLREGNSAIVYRIDEDTLRVVVVDIHDTKFHKEVQDAS